MITRWVIKVILYFTIQIKTIRSIGSAAVDSEYYYWMSLAKKYYLRTLCIAKPSEQPTMALPYI